MKKQPFLITTAVLLQIANSLLPTMSCAQQIAAGNGHSLAICSDSTIRAWGWNVWGQLGNGSNSDSNVPVQVSSLTGIIAIAGGSYHSLALKNDGTVWAWGNNNGGQLGTGTGYGTDSNIPVEVSSLTGVITIAGGSYHSLALKNDGTVWAWGDNLFGDLGDGSSGVYAYSYVPVQVNSLTGIIAIGAGADYSVALKNDGSVWAWGWDKYGQLGNGDTTDSNVPVQVSSLTGITAISIGWGHSLALKNDGTVWAWGWNQYGQLGNGDTTDSNVPMQVGSLTGITAIAAGYAHSLAVKNDGTLSAWGANYYGELGNGTNSDSNIPVQVNSLTGIAAIATGYYHSLALKNDGTLWAWGANANGQLGNGTNTDSNVPVQVMGLCQILSSVNDASTPLPKPSGQVSISVSIFPNPTSANSSITYILSTPATVTIDLYDVLRNKLQQLVNGDQQQGEHNTTFDTRKLANGVYVLQIRAGDQVAEQKVVVMN
ncbi:MAG TPA: T9SS type A sorting domain-containing protein [Chitinophagales bacterium]|nr:T9SS type A sorting domain-containing protein [Chitinophagales bacterium]